MTLLEMYQRKGELITKIEIAQAQLQEINRAIINEANREVKSSRNENIEESNAKV